MLTGLAQIRPVITVQILVVIILLNSCTLLPEDQRFISAHRSEITTSGTACDSQALETTVLVAPVASQGLSQSAISVLNWNLYKNKLSGWQEDLDDFTRQADLILLQEAYLTEEFKSLLYRSRFHWTFNSSFRYMGIESGVLTASPIPPLASCGMVGIEPVTGLPKTALVNFYPLKGSGVRLLVANIHGVNMTLGTGSYRQQVTNLGQILENHNGPIIVAGDFNDWSSRRTEIVATMIRDLDMKKLTFEDDKRTSFFGAQVDHILYRGLTASSSRVEEVKSSDHNPLMVVFHLDQGIPSDGSEM